LAIHHSFSIFWCDGHADRGLPLSNPEQKKMAKRKVRIFFPLHIRFSCFVPMLSNLMFLLPYAFSLFCTLFRSKPSAGLFTAHSEKVRIFFPLHIRFSCFVPMLQNLMFLLPYAFSLFCTVFRSKRSARLDTALTFCFRIWWTSFTMVSSAACERFISPITFLPSHHRYCTPFVPDFVQFPRRVLTSVSLFSRWF
jgi:hypothetical protein